MVVARFHKPRELADQYIGTRLRAASFFTASEIEGFTFKKIGLVVVRGASYITFFKYDGVDEDPCQKLLLQGPALAHMVDTLSKMNTPKARELLEQMKEGLAMIRTFAPHQLEKPKGCKPA